MDTDQRQESEPRSNPFYAKIPHMADDDLDIFEYRLFGHYTRVCGQDGRCYQSVETIRGITKMSPSAIKKARVSLQEKGFITVAIPDGKSRNQGMNISVSLVDRWDENTERYQGVKQNSVSANVPMLNQLKQNMELADSPAVPVQEEPLKEEPLKEEKTTAFAQPANQEPVAGVSEDVVVSEGEKLHIRIFTPVNIPLLPARVAERLPSKPEQVECDAFGIPLPPVPPAPLSQPPEDKLLQDQDNPLGRVLNLIEHQDGWGKSALETDCKNAQLALDEHPEDWVIDAIKEGKFKNKKFWGFVTGCLNNWKTGGAKSPTYNRQKPAAVKTAPAPDYTVSPAYLALSNLIGDAADKWWSERHGQT